MLFMKKVQESKQIKIKTSKVENIFKMEISDNAGGISDEIKHKIF